jgi:hypothetical protein
MIQFDSSWVRCLPLAALLLTGCGGPGDAPQQYTVSGTVTLDNQPLESGNILFTPADGVGRPDGGPIADGKYSFPSTPGEKFVEITSTKEVPAKEPGGIPDYVSVIPAKYQEAGALKATVKAEEDEGANTVNFELSSK